MSEEAKKEETNQESTEAVETKPKSNLIKYIIYGVSGLVLICGIAFGTAFLMKDDSKAEVEPEESSSVVKKAEDVKASDTHAVKEDNQNTNAETSHADEHSRDENLEISKEDFYDAGEDEFDAKAIEKIVDNLALLEYTPTESELEAEDNRMTTEDSLEQMSWIEKEKLEIKTKKAELDSRERELNKLEKSVDSKIIKIEQAESNRTNQLAKLYDGMDSRAVAKLMMSLDDGTVVAILPRMKSKNAALVLQLLPSQRAASLSKQMITIADN